MGLTAYDLTVCSFPPEYCEFGAKKAKYVPTATSHRSSRTAAPCSRRLIQVRATYRCMSWLEENHPALFAKYYSESMSAP